MWRGYYVSYIISSCYIHASYKGHLTQQVNQKCYKSNNNMLAWKPRIQKFSKSRAYYVTWTNEKGNKNHSCLITLLHSIEDIYKNGSPDSFRI